MEKVLLQAELLAEAILDSEEYIRMRLCEQATQKDEKASQLVGDYGEKRQRVEELLAANELDREALAIAGEELRSAETAIDEYELLKSMREARTLFSDMMDKVNAIIKYVVTGEEPEEESGGCSGSCSSCGGGCHQH